MSALARWAAGCLALAAALVAASLAAAQVLPGDDPSSGDAERASEPPRTRITAAPPKRTDSTDATFEFESSQPDSAFECRLDRGEWEDCDSPRSYSGLRPGRHAFKVRATSDDQIDETPAIHRWQVAAAGPQVSAPVEADLSLRAEDFGSDPGWEEQNNRLVPDTCPTTAQDFGHSATTFANSVPGEIGGEVWNSYTPAYYGKVLASPRSLSSPLSASGKLNIRSGAFAWRDGFTDHGKGLAGGGPLFGFFNSGSRDWRTPNSLVLRLEESDGPGRFAVGVEYGTQTYMAFGKWLLPPGGAKHLVTGKRYRWKLSYDPSGANGRGRIKLSIENVGKTTLDLQPGHKAQGAVFDRFGLINRMIEGNESTAYFDGLKINGRKETLGPTAPAGWEGQGNRDSFADCVIDDLHDFGYTADGDGGAPDHAAGGVIWRTEADRRDLSAHYADRIGPLDLDREIYADGTVRLARASSDSAVSFGFFKSGGGDQGERVPHNFVGINTDGPSEVGFYFRPVFRSATGELERPSSGPRIIPDGTVHRWSLHYVPTTDGGASLTATLDGDSVVEEVSSEDREGGARLDRFGIRNVTVGGHGQIIYLDDLRYTADPAPGAASE
jgi:hypothetical protein